MRRRFRVCVDEARKQLSEKGINISDELLAFMVSKDAKETKEAVDSFAWNCLMRP